MKKSITEKAQIAIDELNQAAILMHRQMKSGELDKQTADKSIFSAQRKAKAVHSAYFSRKAHYSLESGNEHLRQLMEFNRSELFDEFNFVNERFGRVLKHYAKAVGAEFVEAGK